MYEVVYHRDINFEEFVRLWVEAYQNEKLLDKLIALFYDFANYCVRIYFPRADYQVQEDLVQCGVEGCLEAHRSQKFHGNADLLKSYLGTILRYQYQSAYGTIVELTKYTELDAKNCSSQYSLENELGVRYYEDISKDRQLQLWNICISNLRFTGELKELCNLLLWMIIFEKGVERSNFILNRKLTKLKLSSPDIEYMINYCEILHRLTLSKFRKFLMLEEKENEI